MTKRIAAFLSAMILLVALATAASAVSVPDLSRRGTVNATLCYGDSPVSGGSLTLYRVAEIQVENNADYSFCLTGEFAGADVKLDALDDLETAAALAQFVLEHDLEGTLQKIGESGKVSFGDLELGLYLVIQQEAAEGFKEIAPFLVSLPGMKDGIYIYEVDASPKLSLILTPTEPPTEPTTEPTEPPPPKLPQTGLLLWPIPVLAIGGLLLMVIGWALRTSERKQGHEG